ncbi:hypothetical protein RYA05_03005 [Pseudomonas syringae pv. actinidiae]|nr:hypothetical protein [Pseudomonas syringae pv. actinidiae]
MNLEQIIEDNRTRMGTHDERLAQARERMRKTNLRLAKEWEAQKVTQEILEKVISL